MLTFDNISNNPQSAECIILCVSKEARTAERVIYADDLVLHDLITNLGTRAHSALCSSGVFSPICPCDTYST